MGVILFWNAIFWHFSPKMSQGLLAKGVYSKTLALWYPSLRSQQLSCSILPHFLLGTAVRGCLLNNCSNSTDPSPPHH